MHPATATTPFTLLWALEKNEEDPPFLSFGAARATRSPSRAITTPLPTRLDQHAALSTEATREHARATPKSTTANTTSNETNRASFAASDFLVTNLRTDLLD